MVIGSSTLTVMISYSILFMSLLLPQYEENKTMYLKKLKILALFLIPSIVSTITVNCLERSCPDLAKINSIIIMIWCICTSYIYLFKKLI